MSSRLKSLRSALLARIAALASASGRDPGSLQVVAVTKSVEPAVAAELATLGSLDLGENRAPELERKAAWMAGSPALHRGRDVRWHFLGHLQRNKARRVLRLAHAIHSVDSVALWETLARLADEDGVRPGIYLQAKLVDEPSKGGLDPENLATLVERARSGPLPLLGLMTMAPLLEDPDAARAAARSTFEAAAALARALPGAAFVGGRPRLSMGMSQDFPEAIAAGADVLRIGSAFFEEPLVAEAREGDPA